MSARGLSWRWFLRRLALIPVSVFVVMTISFGIVNLSPGDPAQVIAGPTAGPADVARVRHDLGLDRSIPERYVSYVGQLVRGDLGESYFSQTPVTEEIWKRFPATVELVVPSLALAVLLGLCIGGVGAYFRRPIADRAARLSIGVSQSLPDFYLGLVLIYLFFAVFHILPAPTGRLGILDSAPPHVTGLYTLDSLLAGNVSMFMTSLGHAVIPIATLAIVYSSYFAKTTRSVLRTELTSKYVEFARCCGLSERRVVGYALLVGRTQLMTYGAILLGVVIGGTSIIETVFAWGGVGQWALDAILKLDLPVIQAFILLAGTVTLLTYLVLDTLVTILDPRISSE